jgi:hypothetical protein
VKAISAKLLPHTVTLFNVWRDLDTGEVSAHRTILERVRVGVAERRYSTERIGETLGPPERYEFRVLVDSRTTIGYELDEGDARIVKPLVAGHFWEAMGPADKASHWTLRTSDWIYYREGDIVSICDPYDPEEDMQAFLESNAILKVSQVPAVIDKDGTIHHWELVLD